MVKSQLRWPIFFICCLALYASYTLGSAASKNIVNAAHPSQSSAWVDTRLYFGLGPADQQSQGVSEAKWRNFLDEEVTPRFPDGLSVLDVYGQWRDNNKSAVERLRSKMIVIDYEDTTLNRAKIEAIRTAWKKRTGDDSVLRVTIPADISF